MKYASKMLLIPENTYSALVNQKAQEPPIVSELGRVESQLNSVLADPSLSVDERYAKYVQSFQRLQHLRETQRNPLPYLAPSDPLPKVTNPIGQKLPPEILCSFAKMNKKAGELLISHIESNPVFQWDEKFRLIVDGQPLKGSNMLDLIHDFTKFQRGKCEPAIGSEEFGILLKQTNVPHTAIGSKTRRDMFISPDRYVKSPVLHNASQLVETPSRGGPLGTPYWNMESTPKQRAPKQKTPTSSPFRQRRLTNIFDNLRTIDEEDNTRNRRKTLSRTAQVGQGDDYFTTCAW